MNSESYRIVHFELFHGSFNQLSEITLVAEKEQRNYGASDAMLMALATDNLDRLLEEETKEESSEADNQIVK